MGKKRRRIKPGKSNQGPCVRSQEPGDYDSMPPVFSLEKLVGGEYCMSNLNKDHKSRFADAVFRLRGTSWKEIKSCGRHELGMEKIARSSIRVSVDNVVTDDVEHFLAFRYNGKCSMVGYRQRNVFYVLWFDHNFTLYDHG